MNKFEIILPDCCDDFEIKIDNKIVLHLVYPDEDWDNKIIQDYVVFPLPKPNGRWEYYHRGLVHYLAPNGRWLFNDVLTLIDL